MITPDRRAVAGLRILTINTSSTADFERGGDRWTPALEHEFTQADIVLGLFSPHSHLILKGPAGLEVVDAREAWASRRKQWTFLRGSRNEDDCAAENAKLLRRSRGRRRTT